MNKLNTTIILSLILMLSGCAANTDEAPSATTAATTTTVATTTTAATTTQATTTSAQTTAVTEQSEPVETTAVTTTVATTEPEVVEDEKPEPEKPAESTTPDGKYDLADTDLVNDDGTYTQTLGSGDPSSVTVPSACTGEYSAWNAESASNPARRGKSNPSQIPYSQITLENAHEAFPYMGFTGQHPGYIEILPSDSPDIIAGKIWNNLVGNESLGTGRNYEGYGFGYMPEHVFSSEAEYNAYVADQKAQRALLDAAVQQAAVQEGYGNHGFTGDLSDEELQDILAGW